MRDPDGVQDALSTIPVFFSERMVAPDAGGSPSASKPRHVVATWRAAGFPLTFHDVSPATVDELARAHAREFVEDVLIGKRSNGFGTRSMEVARSLPFTTGAMLTAARHVRDTGVPVAAAPASGFHHAGHASAGAYCTFNGLMVTALALLDEGRTRTVGILDCDMHYGDGTDDILDALDARDRVRHFTAGAHFHHPSDAPAFFRWLDDTLAELAAVDLVLYQAGADPHVDDPLGGFLTDAELLRRDRAVFAALKAHGVPVVWNLAGGYQLDADGGIRPVLAIHEATMRACVDVFGGRENGAGGGSRGSDF